MHKFKHIIEWHVFGVYSYIGEKIGIANTTIRKYFIYVSLLTMGSPIIIYMFLAFWLNIRNYLWSKERNPLNY